MRLLQLESSGNFSLTEDYTEHVPLYAILSHTWGKDTEEVNFDDFKAGTYTGKTGYRKIQFCGEQAARDGLQYFWVDSCCINKSNHTELSEAINSMFSWYGNAAKCYVYLSDVSTRSDTDDSFSPSLWKLAFRDSRWFTRAWTLQELIAPHSVEFFSREGERLGNKRSLELSIHEITGIPLEVFRGKPLTQLSIQSGCNGQQIVPPSVKKTRRTLYWESSACTCHLFMARGERMRLFGSRRRLADD